MKTFYIRLSGYCDTTLGAYRIEANSFEEAEKIAFEKYVQDIQSEEITEEEYKNELVWQIYDTELEDVYEEFDTLEECKESLEEEENKENLVIRVYNQYTDEYEDESEY